MISFEWDPDKNKQNIKKHGVSFGDASSVFYDENAVQFFDEDHSNKEDRFFLLGEDINSKLLLVCHCERDLLDGLVIRIISARKATSSESKLY